VLDAGCGTGDKHPVLRPGSLVIGIDFVEEAIRRVRSKAAARALSVEFLARDALTLRSWGERFATVIDSGLFHVFSDDDRRGYVVGRARAGGRLFLAGRFRHRRPKFGGTRLDVPSSLLA
jgi:2-polyprenyl-3-methyl-5-hydroxy-6-metoxy-1,4-benzoquinol methylase